jgi:NTP pyrophosphatase (non-canonical NTP hydrolase)
MGEDLMNYVQEALRSENKDFQALINRVDVRSIRLLHGAMGLDTESGEIMDSMKRHIIYGSDLNVVNIREELGDIMWYVALICDELEITIEQICQDNIDKLRKRYPDKFTKELAENRDVANELSHFTPKWR